MLEDTLNKSVASGETRSAGARRVGEGFDALPRPSWTSHPPPQTTRVATLDPWGFAKFCTRQQKLDTEGVETGHEKRYSVMDAEDVDRRNPNEVHKGAKIGHRPENL